MSAAAIPAAADAVDRAAELEEERRLLQRVCDDAGPLMAAADSLGAFYTRHGRLYPGVNDLGVWARQIRHLREAAAYRGAAIDGEIEELARTPQRFAASGAAIYDAEHPEQAFAVGRTNENAELVALALNNHVRAITADAGAAS